MSEIIKGFSVRTRRGRFNWVGTEESVCVDARIEGLGTFSFHREDQPEIGADDRWSEFLIDACDRYLAGVWIDTYAPKVKELRAWLESERNCALLDRAWANQRINSVNAEIGRLMRSRSAAETVLDEVQQVLDESEVAA